MPAQPIPTPAPCATTTPWWHDLPADGATPCPLAELRLRSLVANATGARLLAVAHTVWAISRLDDIGTGGSSGIIELSGTYTRDGAGVSQNMAYRARREVASCLGAMVRSREADKVGATYPDRPSKRWGDVLVLGREELAAARVVARWCIETGAMVEPVLATTDVPTGQVLPGQSKRRGRCCCPCGGHKNDDEHPSGVYDLDRRRLSCLATGGRFKLQQEGDGWLLMQAGTSAVEAGAEGGNNTYLQVPAAGPWPSFGRTALGSLGASMTWRSSKDNWRDIFERAERTGNGEKATREAWARAWEAEIAAGEGRTPTRQHEDQLIALDAWAITWRGRRPVEKRSIGVGRVLMDFDGLAPALLSESEWATLVERLDEVVHSSELLERVEFATETSANGLQLVVRLTAYYWDAREFHRSPAVRAELRRVGQLLLELVDRGGLVDESAWASGRYGRLPGVRVKAGEVVHARLRWASEEGAEVVQLDEVRRARDEKLEADALQGRRSGV